MRLSAGEKIPTVASAAIGQMRRGSETYYAATAAVDNSEKQVVQFAATPSKIRVSESGEGFPSRKRNKVDESNRSKTNLEETPEKANDGSQELSEQQHGGHDSTASASATAGNEASTAAASPGTALPG